MTRLLFGAKNQSDFSARESQKNLANLAKAFGADAIESCAAVFELKGNQYLLCMDTIRYGDQWLTRQMNGNLGTMIGIPAASEGLLPVSGKEVVKMPEMCFNDKL